MRKIAIHSVPRSGSTWLGSIFDSSPNVAYRYQPLFSYQHKGILTPASSNEEINNFFNDILNTNDKFVLQIEAIQRGLVPSFKKNKITHVCYKEVRYHHILENILLKDQEIKIIGLVRNPFAVVNSWLRAPKEFKKELGWKSEEEWRYAPSKNGDKPEEFNGYQKWVEVTWMYLKLQEKFPDQFVLVRYDDLINNTLPVIKSLFSFCELNLSDETVAFLNESQMKNVEDAYAVYKTKNNDDQWGHELPDFIQEGIMQDEDFIRLNRLFKWI